MSKLKLYDATGASAGDVDLADGLLETRRGSQAVHESVLAHLAAKRAGTASSLAKVEVAGSNKKPWRQKGTGRARAGYRQSPVWRGGGAAFGPKPRTFDMKVNRKVSKLAFRRAFSEKVAAGVVHVIEGFDLAEPRTKILAGLMKSLAVPAPTLILVDRGDRNLLLASRNLAGVEVVPASDVNVYALLHSRAVVVSKAGLEIIKQRLGEKAEVAS